MFHFHEPGVRYTRATPTLRRPTACQRSSGVMPLLIGPPPSRSPSPPPRRAAAAAAPRGDDPVRRTLSASVSPSGATAWSWAACPRPPARSPAATMPPQPIFDAPPFPEAAAQPQAADEGFAPPPPPYDAGFGMEPNYAGAPAFGADAFAASAAQQAG